MLVFTKTNPVKEYEITGRLPIKKPGHNPIIKSRHNAPTEQEAIQKFKKRYKQANVIGWVVTKFIFNKSLK